MHQEHKLTYLVVENIPDVCEGIIERIKPFDKWKPLGYCTGVKSARQCIEADRPALLFMDWDLNGGSAFELLQQIDNMPGYEPYIIFNTAFQKDNPEIPQEIVNKYRVDKYLVKPLWEHLSRHLAQYLAEAEQKAGHVAPPGRKIWLEEQGGGRISVDLSELICILQHPLQPRCRNFYFANRTSPITVPLPWQECQDLLAQHNIDFFPTKCRSHLVVRSYIEAYDKPYLRLRGLSLKFEVVKESLQAFGQWLLETKPAA